MERQDEHVVDPAPDAAGEAPGTPVVHAADPTRVTLSLPAHSRYIRVARLVAAGLANELGYDVDRLDDVRLAIGEVCGLAVQAGAVQVTVVYGLEEDRLDVTVGAEVDGAHELDSDYLALVEQVLAVVCSEHDVGRDGRRISARLVFSDGR